MKFKLFVVVWLFVICTGVTGMTVDLYVHKDKYGQSLEVDVSDKECTNVPRPWANLTQSIDTHGSCMQFYDEKSCRGRIAVIQPFHAVHQMDLSLISFDNAIESISPCGPKVQSGRFVIQSAVDASILTVAKTEGQFASAQTLPPRPFIPKAQQWDIEEKQPHEYDIMPRIHEENFPVTYDGDAMKRGSFIRKRWKIESVGRGRYIIRSEWTQKCLYKTRLRRVEENDCRSWSPAQEWVLRPLLTRPKPSDKKPEIELADGINFRVPSRVVDEHLAEKRKEKDQADRKKKKKFQQNNNAYLAPYRIRRKNKRPSSSDDDDSEDDEEHHPRPRTKQRPPPKPEVMYTPNGLPLFGMSNPRQRKPQISYINGVYPIYEDTKAEDPTFPDFLLNTEIKVPKKNANQNVNDEYVAPQYKVTRRPLPVPYPNLPNLVTPKPKYGERRDGNKLVKIQSKRPEVDTEDEEANDDTDDDEEEAEDDDAQQNDDAPQNDDVPETEDAPEQEDKEQDDKGDSDDPGADVASFLKLLFKGISSKMTTSEKNEEEMIDLFEKKR